MEDSPNGTLFDVAQKVKCDTQDDGRWCVIKVGPVTVCPELRRHWTDSCCGASVGSSLRPFTFHCPPPPPPTSRLHTLPLLPHNRAHLNSVFRVKPSWSRQLRHESCGFRSTGRVQMKHVWAEWGRLCLRAARWHFRLHGFQEKVCYECALTFELGSATYKTHAWILWPYTKTYSMISQHKIQILL